jgi:HlyD family secretion protein/epimerase transport system membrane fusion protein
MVSPVYALSPSLRHDVTAQPDFRRWTRVGLVAIGAFVGIFSVWSIAAPLESGSVAPGIVQVQGDRKSIQNLEGGIIREIFVRENQAVEAGEMLLLLDDTQSGALAESLQAQRLLLLAQDARLTAERDGKDEILFSEELVGRSTDPRVRDILAGQTAIFANRATVLRSEEDIYRQRIAQAHSEIASYQAQVTSQQRQLELVQDELTSVRELQDQGFVPKTRLLELERAAAALLGERDEFEGQIARARQVIAETSLQIGYVREKRLAEISQEQRDVLANLLEVTEQLRAAADTNQRRSVRAPVDGVVANLRFPTPGSVVPPGALIMEIVPSRDDLIVDARVAPTDIDVVHVGLAAEVKLTAFQQRRQPILGGEVISVSPDALTDDRTGEPYYLAEIRVPVSELAKLRGERLMPGMPADVVIAAGERTLLQYLLQPLTDSLWRAFREG